MTDAVREVTWGGGGVNYFLVHMILKGGGIGMLYIGP